MNLKNLINSVLVTAILLGLMSIASFAQVYVNNTNGDDFVGQGTQVSPYKTIAKALTVAPSGSVISIAADTYTEANVSITKPFTLVATTFAGLSTVTIANGVTINTTNATDVVNLGRTADGSLAFKLGTTNLANALVLTKGALQISTANVTIADGGTITRTAGTLDNFATVSNVNVTFNGTSDATAGGEVAANIGTGLLTVNVTAGKTVTFNSALTTSGGVTITTGNANFVGSLALSSSDLRNTPAGNTVTVGGAVTFTTGHIINSNTGAVTVNGNVTWTLAADVAANAISNVGNGNITINGAVGFVKSTTGAANYSAAINNNGTGTLTLAQGFTVTPATIATVVYTPVVSATNAGAGNLIFNGAVALTDLTNSSTGSVTLQGGSVLGTVANNAGGKVELLANTTFAGTAIGNNNLGSVIKLNGNTLTLSAAGVVLTNAGKVISTTAATLGAGTVAFTANGTVINGGTNSLELPNVSVASGKTVTVSASNVYGSFSNSGTLTVNTTKVFGGITNSGTFTGNITTIAGSVVSSGAFTSNNALTIDGDLTSSAAFVMGANLTLKGNYAQNVGGTLAFGANTFEVWNNWVRSSNVPGDVTYAAGAKLLFNKGNAQVFTPGASLVLYDVAVTKDAGTVVTLNQSLQIANNFTISTGKVDLGDFNVRMSGAAGTFTNNGNFYTTTGNGYVIFEGAGAAYGITGTGTFSNMDIRGASTVTAGSNINFSGKLILRDGVLAIGANTFTYKNDLVAIPSVTRNTVSGTMTVGAGLIQVSSGVVYDLTYIGDASVAVAAEWIPGGINNLTIDTGDKAAAPSTRTISGPTADFTIAGNLTVNLKQILDLNTFKITFAADAKTHIVVGKVINGLVEVTGDNVKINGSTLTAADAEIPNLSINTTAAKTFTSTDLKKINGTLTAVNGTSTVNMNATTANVTGTVTLTAGTLNLNMNSVASAQGGNVVVTAGTLTYTRKTDAAALAADQTIGGTLTLTAGTFKLGSNVFVARATSQVDGGIDLNGFNFTQNGSADTPDFLRSGTGSVAGAGTVVFDATVAAIDVTPGTTFSIPNVEFKGANGTTLNGAMTVSNSVLHTSGDVALNTLTVTGNTYTYKAGSYSSGTLVMKGSAAVITASADMTVPNFTVNTTGKVTFASNNTTKRTINVGTAFTQTAGDVATGINDVIIAGAFTRAAGNWSQTTGTLVFNAAGVLSIGDGFAVDNFKVSQAADLLTKGMTVNKYLTLTSGALTTDTDGKLVLGAGATIERQAVGATLAKLPTFGTGMNLLYSTAAVAITSAKELPAVVNNLTVNMAGGGSVILAANVTVNGTLSLANLLNATSTASVAITMADASTLELKANGTTVLDEDLTKAGKLNIVYNGATATTTRELGLTTNATTHTAGNVTFKSNVTLDATATFTGEVKFDGGNLDLNTKDLYVQGDVTETSNTGFFVPTGASASNLYFSGAANTKITLNSSKSIDADLKVTLKKTNGTNTVTLVGGNLDFAENHQVLYFNNGLLVTGDNFVKVDAAPGMGQGFDRTSVAGANLSHVVGNIKKSLEYHGTIVNSSEGRVEFPLGSLDMYRPVALTFNPTQTGAPTVPTATLTVSHLASAPTGTTGLPIADAVAPGVAIARYPEFYWSIKSDPQVSPSITFDLEMTAAGFSTYADINNLRIIRRNGTTADITNQWKLQGGTLYDNIQIAGVPTVVVRNATAGIIAGGAIYTYGLQTSIVATTIPNQTILIGNKASIVLTNPQVFTGTTGTVVYTAQSSNNSVATVAVNADTVKVTAVAPGNADITVSAKDANNDFATTKFSVVVNPVTNFSVSGKVTYDNTSASVLKDVVVTLTPGNLTATTAADGTYKIDNVQNGTYTVKATSTAKWGGANATDALKIANYYNGTQTLTPLQISAADVNASATVNNTDALKVLRRFNNLDTTFTAGDWTFSSPVVTVNGAAVANVDVKALNVGDVNGSNTPTGNLSKAAMTLEGTIDVNPGATLAVPVKVDAQNVGAISLQFKYSEEMATLAGVSSKLEGLQYSAKNGVVTVAWADLSGKAAFNADSKDAFITLNFKPSENMKAGKTFGVELVYGELATSDAKVINAMLKTSEVKVAVPSEFALRQNYPNPFNPSTTIQYDLPVDSKVSLVVFNMLGQEVAALVNGVQTAGTQKVQFNAQNLTSGIYFYTLNVSNGDQKFTQTYKMILMK